MMNRQLAPVLLMAALAAPGGEVLALVDTQAARQASAQVTGAPNEVLSRPAGVAVRDVPLAEALTLLAERARVAVAFSASLLPDRHRVDCSCRDASVAEALMRLLVGTNLDFKEVHGQIVIFPRQSRGEAVVPEAQLAAAFAPAVTGWSVPMPSVLDREPHPPVPLVGGVRGTVTEAGSGRPLASAEISVAGLGRTAITNAAGDYVLLNAPDGSHVIRARLLGYAPVEQTITIVPGQIVTADFALPTATVLLDEVVVTGTAAPVSKRTLGNAITTINAVDIIEKAVNTSVAELLQAKAPGVTVLESSGTPGTAGNIRIRGVTSLAGGSEPVVYVDGVRINASAGGSFRNNWETTNQNQQYAGGGETASALDLINPEDIQSIEVIKGPAAATLYGAEAANGVIQIITKKGRAGDQELRWHAKVQYGETGWGLDRRESLTTCDAVRLANPSEWPGCQGRAQGTVITESYLDDALSDGTLRNASLSVSGGGPEYSFYAAVDNDLEQGIFSNSENERTSTRANFAFYPSDKVEFAVNLGYSRGETSFPMAGNGPNVIEAAWTYQPGRTPQPGQTYGFAGGTPEQYELYDNRLTSDRIVLGTTLTYYPFRWFRNRLTVGGDISSQQANRYIAPGGLFSPTEGQMTQGAPRQNIYTVDYAGTLEHRLPIGRLPSSFTFGLQYTNNQYRNTVAQGTGFSSDLVNNVGSSTQRFSWDQETTIKTLGVFAQEQVGWRDRLYLTGAVRVDNSSVFGDEIDVIVYPKVSLAYVISEESFLQRVPWLGTVKLRAAWGQAGNAPGPFAKVTTYGVWQPVDPVTGEVTSAVRLQTLGNPNVKPERASEIELGFDAGLLDDRLGLEFTYYNKTTRDALMQVPLTPSEAGIAGGTQLRNLGEINNKGIELSVLATPIRSSALTWDTRLGLFTNSNRLVEFGFDRDSILLGVTTLNQRHVEGYPLAGYWVHDPVLDQATGNYVPSAPRYAGSSMPTREASLSNTFTLFRNLRLYGLLDYKGGHYLLNMTDWRRCRAQLCAEVNDPGVSAGRKAMLQADLSANDALYTQRADFIKLREISLTYTVPIAFSRGFGADRIGITLAGHNLGYLWKPHYKGLDPEVTFNGINQPGGDGQTFGWVRMDYWTVPMLRRLTASVDVSF